ncbi:MAG: hypothetical protein IJ747_01220 [Lachnospiraceae bacterium]|nr:hypothetical protein [Lachnospiraceae bacterium]
MQENSVSNAQLEQAMDTLRKYVYQLAERAEESQDYAADLWERIKGSEGVLKELAYYHDYGNFWGKYSVAGYTLTDILVWQVDHFKAYLDRHEDVNRWKPERLFLHSLDVMLRMEQDPAPYVDKLTGETGTDFVGKFKEF